MTPETTEIAQSSFRERRYRRFKLQYPVHLRFRSGELISEADAVTRDLSIGGLLLDCPVSPMQDAAVTFLITIQRPALRQIDLIGAGLVVRVEPGGGEANYLVAIESNEPITQLHQYLPPASS